VDHQRVKGAAPGWPCRRRPGQAVECRQVTASSRCQITVKRSRARLRIFVTGLWPGISGGRHWDWTSDLYRVNQQRTGPCWATGMDWPSASHYHLAHLSHLRAAPTGARFWTRSCIRHRPPVGDPVTNS